VPSMEQKFYIFWKGLFTRGGKEKEVVQTYCTDGAARHVDRSLTFFELMNAAGMGYPL
jgi:hypothetical protein